MDQENLQVSRSYPNLQMDDQNSSRQSNEDYVERQNLSQGRNSVPNKRGHGELSGSLLQDEFGSAEAMEYTPSQNSQNNSLPTHLVTASNSNVNMSGTKGSYNHLGQYQNSPSPNAFDRHQMMLMANYQHLSEEDRQRSYPRVQEEIMKTRNPMKAEPTFEGENSDSSNMINHQYDQIYQQQRSGRAQPAPKFIIPKNRHEHGESFGQSKAGTPGFQMSTQMPSVESIKQGVEPFPQDPQSARNSNSVSPGSYQTSTTPPQPRHGVISLGNVQMIEKASAKIKEQAERLQQYEQYFRLCEQRILKLDPKHPLPVTPEHLNAPSFSKKEKPNPQLLNHLQQRVSELQFQIQSKSALEARLRKAEESLRKEMLESEEQRAYIDMLKDQLNQKITGIGLTFDNSFAKTASSAGKPKPLQKPVDGYIKLVQTQKQLDDLQQEHQRLLTQSEHDRQSLEGEFQAQKDSFLNQIASLEAKLNEFYQKKEQLKEDKETLLDYAKESLEKQQSIEEHMKSLESIKCQQEGQIKILAEQSQKYLEELTQQRELVQEARANAERMRKEKSEMMLRQEETGVHRSRASGQIEILEQRILRLQQEKIDHELTIKAKMRTIEANAENEADLKRQLTRANETVHKLDCQLEDTKDANATLQNQCYELRRTLEETQKELDDLVKRYDQAVKDLEASQMELRELMAVKQDQVREIASLQQINTSFREKEESMQRESTEVYASLRRKEDVLKQMEQRWNTKLNEKERMVQSLSQQVQHLEETLNRQNNTFEILERTQAQASVKEKELASQIDEKEREIERYREQVESEFYAREQELVDELQQRQETEAQLAQQADLAERELCEMKRSKMIMDKVLEERGSLITSLENELDQKRDQLKRYEIEISRLEQAVENKEQKNSTVSAEFQRTKEQMIDDALLIERLRISNSDAIVFVNQMIGKVTNFVHSVGELGQSSLDKDLEQATIMVQQLWPATLDVVQPLQQLNRILEHILRTSIILVQNLPQRGSSSGNQNSCEQFFTADQAEHQALAQSANLMHTREPSFPTILQYQQYEHNTVRDMRNPNLRMNANESFHAKSQSAFSQTLPPLKAGIQHQQSQDQIDISSIDISSHPDLLNAKRRQHEAEESETLSRDHKRDLEQALMQMCQLSSIQNPLRKLFQQLLTAITETANANRDKWEVKRKLLMNEQKYHTLSKRKQKDLLSDPNHELIVLKSMIERERSELRILESKIGELSQKQSQLKANISSANNMNHESSNLSHFQVQSLKAQLEEVKKQRDDYREQYEWTQTRLREQEIIYASFNKEHKEQPRQVDSGQDARNQYLSYVDTRDLRSPEFEMTEEHRKVHTINSEDNETIGTVGTLDRRMSKHHVTLVSRNQHLDEGQKAQIKSSQEATQSSVSPTRKTAINPYKQRKQSNETRTLKSDDDVSRASDIIRKKYSRINSTRNGPQVSDAQSLSPSRKDYVQQNTSQTKLANMAHSPFSNSRPLRHSPPRNSPFLSNE